MEQPSIIHIDLILPCYNPHPGWDKGIIDQMNRLYRTYPRYRFRLYLVPDGATKGIDAEIQQRLVETLPDTQFVTYPQNHGKGYAVRAGVAQSRSEYIIYTDYDFPYTDDSFEQVIRALQEGYDVVVAVRDSNYQKNLPVFRKFLSHASHWVNRIFLGLKIKDTQGGLKGFNRKGKAIFLSTQVTSFLFDTEFIYKASRRKDIRIGVVKTRIKDGLAVSEMGFKIIRRELKNFFLILRNK